MLPIPTSSSGRPCPPTVIFPPAALPVPTGQEKTEAPSSSSLEGGPRVGTDETDPAPDVGLFVSVTETGGAKVAVLSKGSTAVLQQLDE